MIHLKNTSRIIAFIGITLLAFDLIVILNSTVYAEEKLASASLKQVPKIFVQVGHTKVVSSVTFSPDGRYALSGSWDNTMKLWEVASGREIRTFQGHTSSISSVAFSPDGRSALSGSQNGAIVMWDLAAGNEIAQMVGFADGEWIAITPEGYFNSSTNGTKPLNVRIENSIYSVDQFYTKFYRPKP